MPYNLARVAKRLGSGLLALGLVCGAPVWSAEAQANPEAGDVELNAQTRLQVRGGARARRSRSYSSDSDSLRLVAQVRIDAINLVSPVRGSLRGGGPGSAEAMPLVTAGVRILDQRLLLGLGFGFAGFSDDPDGDNNETSRFGMTLTPTVTYDLIVGRNSALSLGGMLNLAFLGETENENGVQSNDDAFGLGFAALLGLRSKLLDELAIGAELGWGMMKVSEDDGDESFEHGVLGVLLFEMSMDL